MDGSERYIGFYGCSLGDRIVSVAPPRGTTHRPHVAKTWEVICPACGNPHRVKPTWREAKASETGEIGLTISSEIDPEARGRKKRSRKRGQWSWPAQYKSAS